MPRNQQFLTIGRSTTNNMTLRYRTVSQLHAKMKYQDVRSLDYLSFGGSRDLEMRCLISLFIRCDSC